MNSVALTCPACGSADTRVAQTDNANVHQRFLAFSRSTYEGVMDDWLSDLSLTVLSCVYCGHFWYRDRPSWQQLTAMYDATARRHDKKGVALEPTGRMKTQMQRLMRLLAKIQAPGTEAKTLLDYGSGFGRWARAGVDVGFAVTAYEPSASRGGENNSQAQTLPFTLVSTLAQLDGQKFDAINLEQVLEHIDEPYEALSALHRYCHSETVVRITVPNLKRAYEGKTIWSDWPYDGERAHTLAPFEHLQGFVPQSLRAIVRRAGFQHVSVQDMAVADPALAIRWILKSIIPNIDTTHVFVMPSV